MISVPVMSAGIRSGVNWIRRKPRLIASAIVCTSIVFASPGTPSSRQWPPAKNRDDRLLDHLILPDDEFRHLAPKTIVTLH